LVVPELDLRVGHNVLDIAVDYVVVGMQEDLADDSRYTEACQKALVPAHITILLMILAIQRLAKRHSYLHT
jgi:hypothetical protein